MKDTWLAIRNNKGDLLYGGDVLSDLVDKVKVLSERFKEDNPHLIIVVKQIDVIPSCSNTRILK